MKEITKKFLEEVEDKEIISKEDMEMLKNFMEGKPLK
jgi:hypothetical protein